METGNIATDRPAYEAIDAGLAVCTRISFRTLFASLSDEVVLTRAAWRFTSVVQDAAASVIARRVSWAHKLATICAVKALIAETLGQRRCGGPHANPAVGAVWISGTVRKCAVIPFPPKPAGTAVVETVSSL